MADAHIPLTLVDWLDDLCVRFLVNLPQSELSSVPRLCFQVEEAQWFYEDFVRPAVQASGAPPLPHLPLRQFCLLIFQHCPLLSGFTDAQHLAAYEDFLAYKVRVPVRGAILLDQNMEKLVLVRGWKKGSSWSFPRGKINKDERNLDCAIREVYEETGFDLSTSGLISEHEDDIKYIDVTMREQHVRLFVFRGVPEDTYFETKTRKEISKIQWYWIKDLPGFKRQNKQQQQQQSEADMAHANKFYMVAPFLGHLKKWISQQRKKDIVEAQRRASAMYGTGHSQQEIGIGHDSDDHQYVDVSAGQKEDELKRLLSIGAMPAVQNAAWPDVRSGNLLAMLQGAGQAANGPGQPQTPFEQVNAFPTEPETPRPQHLRQPSMGGQQAPLPPPPFPYSPQRLQVEQQRNVSQPTPGIFGPLPGPQGYAPDTQPGMLPPHLQQHQFQQRKQMPLQLPFEPQNTMVFNSSAGPSMAPQQMSIPQSSQNTHPPNALMAQGPQGAIGSGPAVPKASQLPVPNLNAHTMKLLDAFKGGNNRPTPTVGASVKPSSQATGTHQAALLDLFKKPSVPTPPVALSPSAPVSTDLSSPSPTNTTEQPRRPSKAPERKPTLNEITRTLPLKPKPKASPPPESPIAHDRSSDGRPNSRQLFDPNESEKSEAAKATAQTTVPLQNPYSPVRILQRPSSSLASNQTKTQPFATSSPSLAQDPVSKQNGHQPPAFTILTRPGSSRGGVPPAPSSPLKNETPTSPFPPHLLKRPLASTSEHEQVQASSGDKRDRLLALFGKGASASTSTPPSQTQAPMPATKASAPVDSKSTLLDLFKTNTPQPPPTPSKSPTTAAPPPAPRIQPTLSSAQPSPQAPPVTSSSSSTTQQQTLLLDLFNKTSHPGTSTTPTARASPATPISPFDLGTPMATQVPSIASALAAGPVASGKGTGNGTSSAPSTAPMQAKEFLMGYLNGVVKGAGQR